jgi:ABC-type Fe3+-hydroxamate transport system substrate-binding protein
MPPEDPRITIETDSGETLVFDKAPERIVSLVPSITETLIEIGAGNRVVGITNYCIHPARAVDNIPRLGGPKSISLEKIDALQPDLVITDKEENRETNIEPLRGKYPMFVTYVRSVEQALKMVTDLGLLTRTLPKAAEIVDSCRQLLATAEPAIVSAPLATACFIWRDPWIAVGPDSYPGDLIERFGFRNVFTREDGRYPETDLDDVAELGAEAILLLSERYAFGEPERKEIDGFFSTNGRRPRVLVVDGSYLTWFGYRTIQGLRFLRQTKAKLLAETPQVP